MDNTFQSFGILTDIQVGASVTVGLNIETVNILTFDNSFADKVIPGESANGARCGVYRSALINNDTERALMLSTNDSPRIFSYNKTGSTLNGLPPYSIAVEVWDNGYVAQIGDVVVWTPATNVVATNPDTIGTATTVDSTLYTGEHVDRRLALDIYRLYTYIAQIGGGTGTGVLLQNDHAITQDLFSSVGTGLSLDITTGSLRYRGVDASFATTSTLSIPSQKTLYKICKDTAGSLYAQAENSTGGSVDALYNPSGASPLPTASVPPWTASGTAITESVSNSVLTVATNTNYRVYDRSGFVGSPAAGSTMTVILKGQGRFEIDNGTDREEVIVGSGFVQLASNSARFDIDTTQPIWLRLTLQNTESKLYINGDYNPLSSDTLLPSIANRFRFGVYAGYSGVTPVNTTASCDFILVETRASVALVPTFAINLGAVLGHIVSVNALYSPRIGIQSRDKNVEMGYVRYGRLVGESDIQDIKDAISDIKNISDRQYVMQGSTNPTTNLANYIGVGTGLQPELIASLASPFMVSIADGFNDKGDVDYIRRKSANELFPALPASNKSYLYLNLDGTLGLSVIPPQRGPAFDKTVASLVHFEGANGSTVVNDDYGHTWTVTGGAVISTAQARYGTTSLSLPVAGSRIDTNALKSFSNRWTLECNFRFNALPTAGSNFALIHANNPNWGLGLDLNNTGGTYRIRVALSSNGTSDNIANLVFSNNITPAINTWYKLIMTYDGITYRIFWETAPGICTQIWSLASTLQICQVSRFQIGSNSTFTNTWLGFVDEFRYTQDANRYGIPASIPVPATAYTGDHYWFDDSIRGYQSRVGSPYNYPTIIPTAENWVVTPRLYIGDAATDATSVTVVNTTLTSPAVDFAQLDLCLGLASTNIRILNFGAITNQGKSVTVSLSATLGASFVINEDGLYGVDSFVGFAGASHASGFSINSTQLSTNIDSLNLQEIASLGSSPLSISGCAAGFVFCRAGDVLRPHVTFNGGSVFPGSRARVTRIN